MAACYDLMIMLDLILSLPAMIVGPQLRRNDYAPYIGEATTASFLYERAMTATIRDFNRAAKQVLSEKEESTTEAATAQPNHAGG